MAKYSSFEEMEVYQKALAFGVKIYQLTIDNSQINKDYGLRDQLRRAALSVSNNIAEGFERETKKELIRFLYFSKGSAGECRNIFNFLQLLGYMKQEDLQCHKNDILEISRQLGSYIRFLKQLEMDNKLDQKKQEKGI